jgi:hypothetical protein
MSRHLHHAPDCRRPKRSRSLLVMKTGQQLCCGRRLSARSRPPIQCRGWQTSPLRVAPIAAPKRLALATRDSRQGSQLREARAGRRSVRALFDESYVSLAYVTNCWADAPPRPYEVRHGIPRRRDITIQESQRVCRNVFRMGMEDQQRPREPKTAPVKAVRRFARRAILRFPRFGDSRRASTMARFGSKPFPSGPPSPSC